MIDSAEAEDISDCLEGRKLLAKSDIKRNKKYWETHGISKTPSMIFFVASFLFRHCINDRSTFFIAYAEQCVAFIKLI